MNRLAIPLLVTAVSLLGCGSNASTDRSTTAADDESVASTEQDPAGRPQLDLSKPVPAKSEVIKAWQKRQDLIKTFRFLWTEQQTHPKGWLPNPRYAQREWLNIPGLLIDRSYAVSKTLSVDEQKMKYTFEIDRKEEPDGVRVKSPDNRSDGLGIRRNYAYASVFDGQVGKTSITSLIESPPAVVHQTTTNVDAQNLDTRAILMAFRPLDPVMGHLLIDRAVTNERRRFYQGKSTFLLEERHDPSGWKTMLWVEPERDFLVSRYDVYFEQKLIAEIDIDYVEDSRWGWIPNAWRLTQLLADGSRRLVSEAKVTRYDINQPISVNEFR
ncbi:MAG: hypothetical protein M3R69_18795 [Acidobacteriota bacterium]|nr:hypothetical protein [Acidobacteriota bacterium]